MKALPTLILAVKTVFNSEKSLREKLNNSSLIFVDEQTYLKKLTNLSKFTKLTVELKPEFRFPDFASTAYSILNMFLKSI
jgi:hypothetical protein